MSSEKSDAGIGSFDVVSVTENLLQKIDLVSTFLEVTEEANLAWRATPEQIRKVANDAGMDFTTTQNQMAGFVFPSVEEQTTKFFGNNGEAALPSAEFRCSIREDEYFKL